MQIIPERERLNFLPKHFPRIPDMLWIENTVYTMADDLLDGYGGGFWDYAETDNGAPVMLPPSMDSYGVESPNGFHTTLSREAAGLFLTTMVVNLSLFKSSVSQGRLEMFDKLMATVMGHAESDKLLNLLD